MCRLLPLFDEGCVYAGVATAARGHDARVHVHRGKRPVRVYIGILRVRESGAVTALALHVMIRGVGLDLVARGVADEIAEG
jgi:hypothetical protein